MEALKSIVTTMILALALMQALEMAQVRGYMHLWPIERGRLRQSYGWGGINAWAA